MRFNACPASLRSAHGNFDRDTEAAVSNFGIRAYILTVCVSDVYGGQFGAMCLPNLGLAGPADISSYWSSNTLVNLGGFAAKSPPYYNVKTSRDESACCPPAWKPGTFADREKALRSHC